MPAPSRVADILMEQGRQAGEAARAKGAIWGSTVQRLGEIPGEAIQQHQREQERQQAAKARQQGLDIEAEHLKMLQGDRATAATALKKTQEAQALTTQLVRDNSKYNEETGHWDYNHGAIVNGLMAGGYSEAAGHYADLGSKIDDTFGEIQKKHLAYEAEKRQGYADILGSVAQAPESERASRYAILRGTLAPNAKNDPVLGKLPEIYPGHTAFSALYDAQLTDAQRFARHEKTAADALKGFHETPPGGTLSRTDPETGATTIVAQGEAKPKHYEQKSVLLDGKPAEVHFDPDTGKHYDASGKDVSAHVRPIPPASTIINPALTPSSGALEMAAQRYLATGELPSMGMGSAGAAARVAVMNAAAKIDPQASLSANKATYKADSANLTKLQTTEGTLSAFEKTAGKNLDQFLSLADKIPDTGVPWLNTPVRQLNVQMVGSANMAAINAARDVALREIARVTNDPKLSGALTDSARAEVLGLIPANATLPQIKAVAKVLKTDMANVHQGVNEQIATVKAGLQAHPGAPADKVEEWTRDASGKLVKK